MTTSQFMTFPSTQGVKTPAAGDVAMSSDNRWYKFLQYQAGTAGVAGVEGEICYYYTLDGYRLNQVTSDLSDSVGIAAGVLSEDVADGQWLWVQIGGAATITGTLTASDGDPLTADAASDGGLVAVDAVTDAVCAIACDASDNEIICKFPW